MSKPGLDGHHTIVDDVRDFFLALDDNEWSAPSAAVSGTLNTDLGIEALTEVNVRAKRDWSGAQAAEAFETPVSNALPVFASLQGEPLASTEAPYLDLGTYPLHAMRDLCRFDFTRHLRWDVLSPRGPLERSIAPADEERLGPSVGWLLAAIPRMQPDLADALAGTIDPFSGPGGGVWRLQREGRAITVKPTADGPTPDATVTSSTMDFMARSSTGSGAYQPHRHPWAAPG